MEVKKCSVYICGWDLSKCFLMGGGVRQLAEIRPHMRIIGIILVPKAAIHVVSAMDREPWPDQKDYRSGDENGIT